jgi:ABC-2 type transport system ATP-binding protein
MTAPLRTTGLGKRYRRSIWALRECDLTLPARRVTALVGPNGAGKTTLLHLATGLIRPTAGSIEVFGEPATDKSPAALAKVAFLAQDHPLYKEFRVSELVKMGRHLNPRGFDDDLARTRLAKLSIPEDRRAGQLSGGQQAQVALALALAKRPRLLLLDEPVASLDPLARREFLSTLMTAVADHDLTVLLSSHNVGELQRVCDHLIVLAHGRIRLAGDIDELLTGHRLLTGPVDAVPAVPRVVHTWRGERHVNVVARTGQDMVDQGWQTHPMDLEELVLAYLRHETRTAAGTKTSQEATTR